MAIEVVDSYAKVAQALHSDRILAFKELFGRTPTSQQGDVLREMDKYDAPAPGCLPTRPAENGRWVDHWAIASGNGTGKTDMVSGLVIHFHVTRPLSVILCTASSAPQLHNGLWPRISARLNDMSTTPLGKIFLSNIVKNQEKMYDKNDPENHYAYAQTADKSNETSIMGLHPTSFACFADEASNIDDVCHDAIERDFGLVESKYVFIGNPLKVEGRFFDMFHDDKAYYNTRNWSVLESEVGDWAWANRIIAKRGKDSRIAMINVFGQFPESDDESFIRYDMAKAAIEREVDIDMQAPCIMSIDPAYSHDSCAFAARKGEVMLPWSTIKKYSASPATQIVTEASKIATRLKPKMIFVDANGYGNAIGDMLDAMGWPVCKVIVQGKNLIPEDKKMEYATNGDWLMGEFRDWLYDTQGSIWDNEDKDFLSEIITPQFNFATKRVESKKSAKKRTGSESWDILDAHKLLFSLPYRDFYTFDINDNNISDYQPADDVLDMAGGY